MGDTAIAGINKTRENKQWIQKVSGQPNSEESIENIAYTRLSVEMTHFWNLFGS